MGPSLVQIIVIFFITACIFIQEGYGIKCWVCRSDVDPECGDPFDNSTLAITDCKQERELEHLPGVKATMCRKIIQKEYGRQVVFRSCEWLRNRNDTVGECTATNTPSYSKVEFCATCDSDLCNSAEGLSTSVLWKLLIPVCIAVFMRN